MTIVSGVIGCGGFKFRDFNVEYQVERHVSMMLRQWPSLDPAEQRRETRRMLLDGQCWLWTEPAQGRLFE